jgi:hypothetical protein
MSFLATGIAKAPTFIETKDVDVLENCQLSSKTVFSRGYRGL